MVLQQKLLAHRHLPSRLPVATTCRPRRLVIIVNKGDAGDVSGEESVPPPQQPDKVSQQQQQQQQGHPPGYDPKAAAGFMPLPGDKPFWWVEKFEERRRRLAEGQAATGNSSNSSSNINKTSSTVKPPEPIVVRKAVVQLLQLAVVNAALILWPASLYPGGLAVKQVWLCYWCYMLFFAGGSVYRLLRFGPLAARKKDKQTKTWWTTASWVLFIITMPIIHWSPVVGFIKRQQAVLAGAGGGSSYSYLTVFDVVGFLMLVSAIGLNWWSAQHLGKAYDRVVQPEVLVTTGPYALVQHPIYSSYMLLFTGYSMMLHSAPTALLALVVCLIYYWSRTKLEKQVLQQAFGQQYEEYAKRAKLFIPLLL